MLRTLVARDFDEWSEIRNRCKEWLVKWEPRPPQDRIDVTNDRRAFAARCGMRQRERQLGTGHGFGIFVNNKVAGEINLLSIQRGPMQSATIGYWVDEALAGNGYVPEAVVVVLRFAFEVLGLHRVEISIIPRNFASRRVVEKLGIREEGLAKGFLEINGIWEDHIRHGITAEEWSARREELIQRWISDLPSQVGEWTL